MNLRRKGSGMGKWAVLLVLVGAAQAIHRRSASASASAIPTPIADPNLAAAFTGMSGLGGLSAGGARAGGSANGNENGDTCNSQDLLTNLLVYQYLSGSIPNGAGAPPGAHPQLQALLGSSLGPATTTVTSVSTTLTTLVVEVEPSTQFLTSTTSYVTTLTSVETKVIPVLFRGSKITTTISESSEEVITATEFFTDTSVHSPSIVQTLPVHITMTATSTRGLNGQYTLFELTPGPTSVIHQPISTATLDLDAAGLDLGNLDLTQLDLASLTSGSGGLAGLGLSGSDIDNSQVLSVLSSLLQNYDDTGAPIDPSFSPFSSGGGGFEDSPSKTTARSGDGRSFRGQQDNFRRTRFEETFPSDYPDYDEPVDEVPKFNVLPGFTLSDRVATSGSNSGSGGGRAATDTRYSKYHRKDKVDNNGITAADSNTRERESERFSASTRRRTFSRTSGEQRRANEEEPTTRAPSTRFIPAAESQYFEDGPPKFRPFGPRRDRQTSSRRRSGVLDEGSSPAPRPVYGARSVSPRPASPPRAPSPPRPASPPRAPSPPRAASSTRKTPLRNAVPAARPSPDNVRTTVLTMYLSGTMPGEFSTSLRTVTLRSLATRRRRDVHEDPFSKISPTKTSTPIVTENTIMHDENVGVDPKEIVHLLKSLDSTQVKQMLKSLQKWVDYYNYEVLDDENNSNKNNNKEAVDKVRNSIAPELTSSISMENAESDSQATTELPLSPSSIAGAPSSSNLCYPPPTVTETVYRTFIVTSGMSAA